MGAPGEEVELPPVVGLHRFGEETVLLEEPGQRHRAQAERACAKEVAAAGAEGARWVEARGSVDWIHRHSRYRNRFPLRRTWQRLARASSPTSRGAAGPFRGSTGEAARVRRVSACSARNARQSRTSASSGLRQ